MDTIISAFNMGASVAIAAIACFSLRAWKHQDRAKRKAEFLDAALDAFHTYQTELLRLVSVTAPIKARMDSYGEIDPAGMADGAIAYIQRFGVSDGERLRNMLRDIEPSESKLRSLMLKGHVFNFDGYEEFCDSIEKLLYNANYIEDIAMFISSSSWNFENCEVRQILEKIITIDPDKLRKDTIDQSKIFYAFNVKTFRQIYR